MTATNPTDCHTETESRAVRLETVSLLVPDLPVTAELLPFLEIIDANRWYSNNGPLVNRFENELARFIEPTESDAARVSAVTTSSGTTALELCLELLGLPVGSKIGVPAFTFPATGLAVQNSGFEVILLDVDPQTWCLDSDLAREAIEQHDLKAVVPVAAFGSPIPVEPWDALAEETGVAVVMDAAAALGTQRIGLRTHTTFSLHATKPLGVGEGGVIATRDPGLARGARLLANFGFELGATKRGGRNVKMSEYHAAVGLVQLRRFDQIRRRRLKVTKFYLSALTNLGAAIEHQLSPPGIVRSVFPVLLPPAVYAGAVEESLGLAGIQTRRWYDPGLAAHAPFAKCSSFGYDGQSDLRVTNTLNDRLIGLPFHSFLERDQVEAVCRELGRILTGDI